MDSSDFTALLFLLLAVLFLAYLYIAGRIQDIKEKKQFDAARERYLSFYNTHNLRELTHMPDEYYMGEDNIPREKNIPYGYSYGKTIDVYIASGRSDVYHALGCPYAAHQFARNAFSDYYAYGLYSRRPCSHCNPPPLPDVKWYQQYVTHLDTCRKYEITPIRERNVPDLPRVYINLRDKISP